MKKPIVALLAIVFFADTSYRQIGANEDKKAIENVIPAFMKSIVNKDSTSFYTLFYAAPATWVGISKQKTYAEDLKTLTKKS